MPYRAAASEQGFHLPGIRHVACQLVTLLRIESQYRHGPSRTNGKAVLAFITRGLLLWINPGISIIHGNDARRAVVGTLTATCACLLIDYKIEHVISFFWGGGYSTGM